jgi:hypothetical protein
MSLMQMDYPGLTNDYYISSFIIEYRDEIKHYLILHSPKHCVKHIGKPKSWKRGSYTKNHSLPHQQPTKNLIPQPPKPIPIRPKKIGKCWGYQEPWTSEHTIVCKFHRAVNAMAIDPNNWLAMEKVMEEEDHVLLQMEETTID